MIRQGSRAAKKRRDDLPAQKSHNPARRLERLSNFSLVFAAAFFLRLIYLLQIDAIPLFYYLAGDGRTYDEWAQRIAAGDWLGSGVFDQAPLYPYFLALLQITFGHNLWAIRMVQAILGSISCVLVFLSCEKLFS